MLKPSNKILNKVSDSKFQVYAHEPKEGPLSLAIYNDAEAEELLLHGSIGDEWEGLDAMTVERWLSERKEQEVEVKLNSLGGYAFDGFSIANALSDHPKQVTAIVTGVAASAAATVLQGADERVVYENSSIMIHNAWTIVMGNRFELRDTADFLEKLDGQIAAMMSKRSGKSKKEITGLLDGNVDGTWFTGQEAVDEGFADRMIANKGKGKTKDEADQEVKTKYRADALRIRRRFMQLDIPKPSK